MKDTTKLVATDGILATEAEDEVVMLDPDYETYFGLNPTGAFLWKQLGEPRTVAELLAETTEEFDVPRRECRDDVRNFLDNLLEAGFVERI